MFSYIHTHTFTSDYINTSNEHRFERHTYPLIYFYTIITVNDLHLFSLCLGGVYLEMRQIR